MGRIDPLSVQQTLTTAPEHDPAVLVSRQPSSKLELSIAPNAGGVLTWLRTPDDREPRILGRFVNDQDVQRYMTTYGIWEKRDVPELLRSLQAERARAQQKHPLTAQQPSLASRLTQRPPVSSLNPDPHRVDGGAPPLPAHAGRDPGAQRTSYLQAVKASASRRLCNHHDSTIPRSKARPGADRMLLKEAALAAARAQQRAVPVGRGSRPCPVPASPRGMDRHNTLRTAPAAPRRSAETVGANAPGNPSAAMAVQPYGARTCKLTARSTSPRGALLSPPVVPLSRHDQQDRPVAGDVHEADGVLPGLQPIAPLPVAVLPQICRRGSDPNPDLGTSLL